MKTLKSSVLTLTFITLLFSSMFASGGEGNVITAWASSAKTNRVRIERMDNAPVDKGTAMVAEIQVGQHGDANITLTNREGRVVWGTSMVLENDVNAVKFHFGELPAGLYFLKVATATGHDLRPVFLQ